MHGDVAYCRKHGHDWQAIGCEREHDMILSHVECKRCGLNRIVCYFFEEEEKQ